MRFLIVGGAGYIGSHFVHEAWRQGHECIVYDNLERGFRQALPASTRLMVADIRETKSLEGCIRTTRPDCILHYAAYALVGESVVYPQMYYDNNVLGTRSLLEAIVASGTRTPLIFSSSCAVFGTPCRLPIKEDDVKNPESPYGRSKLISEFLIEDYARAHKFPAIALRYFNACGADLECQVGEAHVPETHLIPNVLRAAQEGHTVPIFGNDFPTRDGTCVRDYIHVADLAQAHLIAARHLLNRPTGSFQAIHLGTGQGYSNQQIVHAAEKIVGKSISIRWAARRAGDPPELFADSSLAQSLLGFKPLHSSLETILKTAWSWQQSHPHGFENTP